MQTKQTLTRKKMAGSRLSTRNTHAKKEPAKKINLEPRSQKKEINYGGGIRIERFTEMTQYGRARPVYSTAPVYGNTAPWKWANIFTAQATVGPGADHQRIQYALPAVKSAERITNDIQMARQMQEFNSNDLFDETAKSRRRSIFVIPAQAGIQEPQ